MLGGKCLKVVGVLTLFFFVFFTFSADFALAKEKEGDVLLKARRLYQEGDYEGSIKLLSDFIAKLKAMVEQKRNVAEAFYLMAKIYFEVGDDVKVDENLRKVFETYPAFSKEERNLAFKDRVEKIKKEVLEAKTKQSVPEEETTVESEEPPTEEKVIEESVPPRTRKKKKFPVLVVVGGIALVVAAILLLKKKKEDREEVYDIRGDWTISIQFLGENLVTGMTFSGSRTNGNFVDLDGDTGTYIVNGRSVEFVYDFFNIFFTGNFSTPDNMNGVITVESIDGSWSGTRGFNFARGTTSTIHGLKAKAPKKNKN